MKPARDEDQIRANFQDHGVHNEANYDVGEGHAGRNRERNDHKTHDDHDNIGHDHYLILMIPGLLFFLILLLVGHAQIFVRVDAFAATNSLSDAQFLEETCRHVTCEEY